MISKKYSYCLEDIENALQIKSWWAMIFVLPIVRRLSLLIINYTEIKPNSVTSFSIILVVLSALCFSQGTYPFLIAGAVLFEISYIFDCVDGTVARVKKFQSNIGSYYDWMTDRFRIVMLCITLGYGQFKNQFDVSILMLCFLYLGLNNLIIITRSAQEKIIMKYEDSNVKYGKDLVKNNISLIGRWINYTDNKKWMPYYHDIETDAVIFFIAPLFGKIMYGLVLGNILAIILIIALNTIFISQLYKYNNQ